MRVERRDGSREKRILIGLITDKKVLAKVAPTWDGERFKTRWANLVGGWCVKYFEKYNDAPKKAIESYFESWCDRAKDKDTIKLVESFLTGLSEEYENLEKESNSDHIVDMAADHFNNIQITRLSEALQGDIENGERDKALKRIYTFGKVEMGTGSYIDVFQNKQALQSAFESKVEPLVTYPGPVGQFFGDAFEREGFVAFMAPQKRSKSFWLLDLAYRAASQRRKTAYFVVGDMSQDQVLRRFATRVAKRPFKARTIKYPIKLKRIEDEEEGTEIVATHEERQYDKPLDWRKTWKGFQKHMQSVIKSQQSYLKLAVYPSQGISVAGIENVLLGWERESEWTADCIIIDYADNLQPLRGYKESRDGVNATWKGLSALRQKKHCLVVTATQGNAASFKAEILDRSHFSEDNRKFAEVTGMIGINQTPEEKGEGIMRLNWLVLREDEFVETRTVSVAGCLAIANPCIRSV